MAEAGFGDALKLITERGGVCEKTHTGVPVPRGNRAWKLRRMAATELDVLCRAR